MSADVKSAFLKGEELSGYIILIGDEDLLAGREGQFTVLDARSHRLARVCRSTYVAELMGTEETFDVGQYCRGCLAEALVYGGAAQ